MTPVALVGATMVVIIPITVAWMKATRPMVKPDGLPPQVRVSRLPGAPRG